MPMCEGVDVRQSIILTARSIQVFSLKNLTIFLEEQIINQPVKLLEFLS